MELQALVTENVSIGITLSLKIQGNFVLLTVESPVTTLCPTSSDMKIFFTSLHKRVIGFLSCSQ